MQTKLIGHRGCPLNYPENTLAAFDKACHTYGSDGVELDVFCSSDGVLVVFHGGGGDVKAGDIAELTYGEGNIQQMTLSEIQALKLKESAYGCPTDVFASIPAQEAHYGIPTLREVLLFFQTSGTNKWVNIEIKGDIGTCEQLTFDLIKELNFPLDQFEISSFKTAIVTQMKEIAPEFNVVSLLNKSIPEDFIQQAIDMKARQVGFRYDLVTPEYVSQCHSHGLKIMAWFRSPNTMKQLEVDERDIMTRLIDMKVDVIISNEVEHFEELRRQYSDV